MPLFRNGHDNDRYSFRIFGFEYNLSPNLFFHTLTQATSQELFWYKHLKYQSREIVK